jgi:hypothetical protein
MDGVVEMIKTTIQNSPIYPEIVRRLEASDACKCLHCEAGYRHPVGDCDVCGNGPAPGRTYDLPKTDTERMARLEELARSLERAKERGPLLRRIEAVVQDWYVSDAPLDALVDALRGLSNSIGAK